MNSGVNPLRINYGIAVCYFSVPAEILPGDLAVQRRVIQIGPFSHRTIVVLGIGVANQLHDEQTVRRSYSTLSICVYVLVGSDAVLRQYSAYISSRLEFVGL